MENLFESKNEFPMSPLIRSEETDKTDEHNWSEDIEKHLEAIQNNCAQQSLISKQEYLDLMYLQRFFKIPVIVLSGNQLCFCGRFKCLRFTRRSKHH